MSNSFNAKISTNHLNKQLQNRVFVMRVIEGQPTIQYSVGFDGLQKKTKFQGAIVHSDFYDLV